MKNGICLYAHNNPEVDYGKMAIICALAIKKNLKENNITLITDDSTLSWMKNSNDEKHIKLFDNIIIDNYYNNNSIYLDNISTNIRTYFDTQYTQKKAIYNNFNRMKIYELTPYENTLLIDTDYLVLTNQFDKIWNIDSDFMLNDNVKTINYKPFKNEEYLNDFGIKTSWMTYMFFRKSKISELFFNLSKHIIENLEFYKHCYGFKTNLFRNDYVASIARHILNGFTNYSNIDSFPIDYVYTSSDHDELYDVKDNKLVFLTTHPQEPWRYVFKNVYSDVHVMNKYSINRKFDLFVKYFGESNETI